MITGMAFVRSSDFKAFSTSIPPTRDFLRSSKINVGKPQGDRYTDRHNAQTRTPRRHRAHE